MHPKFSHLRTGNLATLHHSKAGDVPVKVETIINGNRVNVVTTAAREGIEKGKRFTVLDNLTSQSVTTRTKSGTTLLVY